jgi:hypothetical protein
MANGWPATQGQLYGEPGKLAAEGLTEVIDVGARGRNDAPAFRSAPLLRMFLLGELSPVQARLYLESLHSQAESEHARYVPIRDSHGWSGGDADFFARAALEHGLRRLRMEAEWASWVIDGLDQRSKR